MTGLVGEQPTQSLPPKATLEKSIACTERHELGCRGDGCRVLPYSAPTRARGTARELLRKQEKLLL